MKILTFDIEEWFHILDNAETQSTDSWNKFDSRLRLGVDAILDLLDETGQTATFFCLGWVAEKHPAVIRSIADAGFEIASHSYGHQLAYEQSQEDFRNDLNRSLAALSDLIGKQIDTYRAPGFSITGANLWAFDELLDAGIKVDCSLFPADRAHGGLPSFGRAVPTIGDRNGQSIKLFPINTRSVFGKKIIYSGGGYFRLMPESLLKRWFANDDYIMTYFHPRDFDPGQPMVPGLGPVRRFKSYVGIRGAKDKLRHLLKSNSFTDVRSADAEVDWESAPRFSL